MIENELKIAMAQIAPVWLDKQATLKKVKNAILEASQQNVELIVFGEGIIPGYPFWLALTGGAEWNTKVNKELHAHYLSNAITIEDGDLETVCQLAKTHKIAIYLGVIEKPRDRGGHSIYASLVYIDQPDTIFACGVDLLNDTTFNVFTHTVIANDPSTWNFQMGILAPNFQYYLEVDSTFGLYTIQANPPYDQDAAFNTYDVVSNPNVGPWWAVDGDVLRPDIDVYNPTHTYIYHSPSDVNGGGIQPDYFTGTGNTLSFEFLGLNSPWGDTIHNQGKLSIT